jgi:predicted nucleotidyltransferase/HEPN domain-containing protein
MNQMDAIRIAEKYARDVWGFLPDARIILYGSCAKGTQHSESDIDIAVIVDEFPGGENQRFDDFMSLSKIAYACRKEERDYVNVSPNYLSYQSSHRGFLRNILVTGIEIKKGGLPEERKMGEREIHDPRACWDRADKFYEDVESQANRRPLNTVHMEFFHKAFESQLRAIVIVRTGMDKKTHKLAELVDFAGIREELPDRIMTFLHHASELYNDYLIPKSDMLERWLTKDGSKEFLSDAQATYTYLNDNYRTALGINKETAIRIAEEYARDVWGFLPDARIILFGPYAEGTQQPDSYIDIAVLVDELPEDENQRRADSDRLLILAGEYCTKEYNYVEISSKYLSCQDSEREPVRDILLRGIEINKEDLLEQTAP